MPGKLDPPLSLESRIRRIEDQFAIYQLIVAYGPAVDSVDLDQTCDLWTEDCIYDLEGIGAYKGHAGLRAMLSEPRSQEWLKGGTAHVLSLPYIVIEGDHAVATNYGRIYLRENDAFVSIRVIATRWDLVRTDGGWRIQRRINRLTNGSDEARRLLAAFNRGLSETV
jgi:hypothetical protein